MEKAVPAAVSVPYQLTAVAFMHCRFLYEVSCLQRRDKPSQLLKWPRRPVEGNACVQPVDATANCDGVCSTYHVIQWCVISRPGLGPHHGRPPCCCRSHTVTWIRTQSWTVDFGFQQSLCVQCVYGFSWLVSAWV